MDQQLVWVIKKKTKLQKKGVQFFKMLEYPSTYFC